MFKKIICLLLGIILIMSVFLSAGCGKKEVSLEKYKTLAKVELQKYATALGKKNYTAENWAEIESVVAQGKAYIDEAEEKKVVDWMLKRLKSTVYSIKKIEHDELSELMREYIELSPSYTFDWYTGTTQPWFVLVGEPSGANDIEFTTDRGHIDGDYHWFPYENGFDNWEIEKAVINMNFRDGNFKIILQIVFQLNAFYSLNSLKFYYSEDERTRYPHYYIPRIISVKYF